MRGKLTVQEQIEAMKNNGVCFNECTEEHAAKFLDDNTYFFKIKVFKNNFHKINGKYDRLDFAYLVDLSTIDYRLRALLSSLCLNIEHAMKVRFNKLIMDNPNEDGYQIVAAYDPQGQYIFRGFGNGSKYHRSTYTQEMIEKFCGEPAAWNLWEIMTFSELCGMYDLYLRNNNLKDNVTHFNQSVRILRNAASHNNCLLIGLRKDVSITLYLQNCIKNLNTIFDVSDVIFKQFKYIAQKYPLVHDYACTLMSFLIMVDSKGIRRSVGKSIKKFSDRFEENYHYSTMEQCPELGEVCWAMRYVSDLVAQYIHEHEDDYFNNKILHTRPQKIKSPIQEMARRMK